MALTAWWFAPRLPAAIGPLLLIEPRAAFAASAAFAAALVLLLLRARTRAGRP